MILIQSALTNQIGPFYPRCRCRDIVFIHIDKSWLIDVVMVGVVNRDKPSVELMVFHKLAVVLLNGLKYILHKTII